MKPVIIRKGRRGNTLDRNLSMMSEYKTQKEHAIEMNQLNPRVSVIIPVFNVEAYLRECLDSIIGQSLKEIEIICVNDGSLDASLDILEEYRNRDSRVTVISRPNGGQSAARNDGMRYAHGDYLYFIDSDDYLDTSALEKVPFLQRFPVGMYAFSYLQENGMRERLRCC